MGQMKFSIVKPRIYQL